MRCTTLLLFSLLPGCVSPGTRDLIDQTWAATTTPAASPPSSPSATAPARAPDEIDLSAPLTRAELLRLAVARDPGLAAQAHRVRATLHAARAEGSLPPPSVNAQVWNLPLDRPYALGDASMYMLETRQMLPAAGSLDARARAMAEEAAGMVAELSAREREVRRRADLAYAEYVRAEVHHGLHRAQLDLLAEMTAAVQARYAAGGNTLADIARVQLEQAREQRMLARYAGEAEAARAEINAILLREAGADLGPPADAPREAQGAGASLPALLSLAERSRPSLSRSRARVRAAGARADAARAEARWPAFELAVSYWQDPRMRPGFGTMASMTLPWVWGGLRERVAEAEENTAAAREDVRAAEADVRGEVVTAYARVVALREQLRAVREGVDPAARRALDAVRDAYVAGRVDLLAWLEAVRAALEVKTEEADLAADLARALAELEAAVGAELPNAGAGAGAEVRR